MRSRAIFQDPETYPEPEKFIPERHLESGHPYAGSVDPSTIVFGFGRRCVFDHDTLGIAVELGCTLRICPGRYLADATLFIYMASILHTFDITPPVDEHGVPIRIEPRASTGISSYVWMLWLILLR